MEKQLYMKAGQTIGALLGDGELIEIPNGTNRYRCPHETGYHGPGVVITEVEFRMMRNVGVQLYAGQCSHCGKIYFHSVEKYDGATS